MLIAVSWQVTCILRMFVFKQSCPALAKETGSVHGSTRSPRRHSGRAVSPPIIYITFRRTCSNILRGFDSSLQTTAFYLKCKWFLPLVTFCALSLYFTFWFYNSITLHNYKNFVGIHIFDEDNLERLRHYFH